MKNILKKTVDFTVNSLANIACSAFTGGFLFVV